jgi:aryl-alcohol dehydrogenase-like predicted oxidoreductase
VTSVIVGAKTPEQLEDNLGASKLELSVEDLQALDDVSKLALEYPGWMLERQALYRAKPPEKG